MKEYVDFGKVRDQTDQRRLDAHAKKLARNPWMALEEHWREEMRENFGDDVGLSGWCGSDVQNAKRLVKEYGIEKAKRMVTVCCERWSRDGLPGIGYLWSARDSYAAMADGKIKRRGPWMALEEHWREEMRGRFGNDIGVSSWGEGEYRRARSLVEEYGIEKAKRMVSACITRWNKDGLPGIGYLWKARDSYAAMADGVATKSYGVTRGEYDENTDGRGPDHGW